MEHTLSFKLLGTPTIKVDGNIKIFSFSKINAFAVLHGDQQTN